MQYFIKSLLTLTMATVVFSAHGQGGIPVSEMYLKGKWNAECVIEVRDHASIRFCALCTVLDDPTIESASFNDIKMTFRDHTLTLQQGASEVVTVPYTRDKDNHSFRFTVNEEDFAFRMFIYGDKRIIENEDGSLLVLEKVE